MPLFNETQAIKSARESFEKLIQQALNDSFELTGKENENVNFMENGSGYLNRINTMTIKPEKKIHNLEFEITFDFHSQFTPQRYKIEKQIIVISTTYIH